MKIIFNMEICLENSPEDPRVVWRETDAVAARGFEGVRWLECWNVLIYILTEIHLIVSLFIV